MKGTTEGKKIRKGNESKTQSNKEIDSRVEQKRSEAPVQDQSVDTKMLKCTAKPDVVITSQMTLKPTLCQALGCVCYVNLASQEFYEVRSTIIIVSQTQKLKHREAEYVSQGHRAKTKKQGMNLGG